MLRNLFQNYKLHIYIFKSLNHLLLLENKLYPYILLSEIQICPLGENKLDAYNYTLSLLKKLGKGK